MARQGKRQEKREKALGFCTLSGTVFPCVWNKKVMHFHVALAAGNWAASSDNSDFSDTTTVGLCAIRVRGKGGGRPHSLKPLFSEGWS